VHFAIKMQTVQKIPFYTNFSYKAESLAYINLEHRFKLKDNTLFVSPVGVVVIRRGGVELGDLK
jgi:hypothetical protein